MKTQLAIFIIVLTFMISSCYDDKGNYNYTTINEMSVSFTPANTSGIENTYMFVQPQQDTLYFELTPVVAQSMQQEGDNLEYTWRVSSIQDKDTESDTAYTPVYLFKFPPKQNKTYNVLFCVRDRTTDIEHYTTLVLKTSIPFLQSWYIIHGEERDRKLGVIEYDASGQFLRQIPDVYETLKGKRRFKNAFALGYSSVGGSDQTKSDRLFILEPDSLHWLYPFSCEEKGNMEKMLPFETAYHFTKMISEVPGQRFGIIDINGNYYHAYPWGFFYRAKSQIEDYRIDEAYINNGIATLWDQAHTRFMYYDYSNNSYNRGSEIRVADGSLKAIITPFPEDVLAIDLSQKEVIWMGRGLTSILNFTTSTILRDRITGIYSLFHIGYAKYASKIQTQTENLEQNLFDEKSRFASTVAFANQLFYTKGVNVYLLNIKSGQKTLLYTVGDGKEITQIAFRKREKGTMDVDDPTATKVLGIAAATADGKGEFHQILLNEAGDVVETTSYTGFGRISDFCYSYLEHRAYKY